VPLRELHKRVNDVGHNKEEGEELKTPRTRINHPKQEADCERRDDKRTDSEQDPKRGGGGKRQRKERNPEEPKAKVPGRGGTKKQLLRQNWKRGRLAGKKRNTFRKRRNTASEEKDTDRTENCTDKKARGEPTEVPKRKGWYQGRE